MVLVKHHLGKPRHVESADRLLTFKCPNKRINPEQKTKVYSFWNKMKFAAKDNWEICYQRMGHGVQMMDDETVQFVIKNLPVTKSKLP